MRRTIEDLTQARDRLARGDALLRWQQRHLSRLVDGGHDDLALLARDLLVSFQDIVSAMQYRLQTIARQYHAGAMALLGAASRETAMSSVPTKR
jgi:hypothetical protein